MVPLNFSQACVVVREVPFLAILFQLEIIVVGYLFSFSAL